MTADEANALEREFGVTLPPTYRTAVTDGYPFSEPLEELDTDAESIRLSNQGCRKEDPWEFPWNPTYWIIGGDGAGGFYFINTLEEDSTVYYCDHEDMPTSIDDLDRISVTPFAEFVSDAMALEKEMNRWNDERKLRVANRRWWQIWIPKSWPPKSKAQVQE